jgi:hypothetical protein
VGSLVTGRPDACRPHDEECTQADPLACAVEQHRADAREAAGLPYDPALRLAELVAKAFRERDAEAMQLFGSNAAGLLARDVIVSRPDPGRPKVGGLHAATGEPCACGKPKADPSHLTAGVTLAQGFALEHAMHGAADAMARLACAGMVEEGGEIPRAKLALAASRVHAELSYRVRHLARLLPGPWSELSLEIGDAAAATFVERSRERPTGASLHVERDASGRVCRAWVEPAPLLDLPPRSAQNG